MKKYLISILFLLMTTGIFAQNKSIIPVINQSSDFLQLIEGKYNQQVVHLEFDVIKNQKTVYRQLFGGVQYGIILFGDDADIKDMNLYISLAKNNEWSVVKKDENTEGIVMIYFVPEKTDVYKFDLTCSLRENANFGFYSLIIFR